MNIEIKNPNAIIVKELKEVLKDLEDSKRSIWEDTEARTGMNKAEGRIKTIISLLEG